MEPINKTIWFFGLSGSGKTTLANGLSTELEANNLKTFILDGDIVRKGINANLGFCRQDRKENVRRIAELCKILLQVEVIPIVAAITPYEDDRKLIKEMLGNQLILVSVECSLYECEKRDPKGLYQSARNGEIQKFTGISDTYERSNMADVTINTEKHGPKRSINLLVKKIIE